MTRGADTGFPKCLRPKVVVLLIGTNNIGMGNHSSQEVIRGIEAVLAYLRYHLPATELFVMTLFPRADCISPWGLRTPFCKTHQEGKLPNPYSFRVEETNRLLKKRVGKMQRNDTRLHLLDCGSMFLTDPNHINLERMSDSLHPTVLGYRLLAEQCILPAVEPMLQSWSYWSLLNPATPQNA